MPETRKRTVKHDNGVHVYEGFVAIVERGQVVYKHDAKFEPGDIVSMIYDEVTGRVAYTLNGAVIYIAPPPEIVAENAPPPPDEFDWSVDTLNVE